MALHRRTKSIMVSYDVLFDVLAVKERSKVLMLASIDRQANSQLEAFLSSIAGIFEQLEAEKRPTIHLVVPSYYFLSQLVDLSNGDCEIVQIFKV